MPKKEKLNWVNSRVKYSLGSDYHIDDSGNTYAGSLPAKRIGLFKNGKCVYSTDTIDEMVIFIDGYNFFKKANHHYV